MGHDLQAIIGNDDAIMRLLAPWTHGHAIKLPQGYAMVRLTDVFFDEVTQAFGAVDTVYSPDLAYLTPAIQRLLSQGSAHTALVYLETDYFGGIGTQAGILYENGQMTLSPPSGSGCIDSLLKALGVRHLPGKDEFDTLHLDHYLHTND